MRSHLVFVAQEQVPCRFELVKMAAKVARRLHKPNTCMGTTINQALERIAAQGENEIRQSPDMGLESQVLVAEMQ